MASEERTKEILEGLKVAVKDFEEEEAAKWAKTALEEGVDPFVAALEGPAEGMIMAGDLFCTRSAKHALAPCPTGLFV